MSNTAKRMVIIDGHIVVQYYDAVTGWWTCVLQGNKFAVWEDTRENRFRAKSIIGKMPIVQCNLKPDAPHGTRFYDLELRQLAKSFDAGQQVLIDRG